MSDDAQRLLALYIVTLINKAAERVGQLDFSLYDRIERALKLLESAQAAPRQQHVPSTESEQ